MKKVISCEYVEQMVFGALESLIKCNYKNTEEILIRLSKACNHHSWNHESKKVKPYLSVIKWLKTNVRVVKSNDKN